jgi:hypothetical protein
MTAILSVLVLIKNDPRHKSVNYRQAGVDEWCRRGVRFEVISSNNPSADQRQSQPAYNADHPCRKIGTENIDCGRAVTHRSNHEDQYPDQQDESCKRDVPGPAAPSGWKIRNNSGKFCFHLRGCLTIGGVGRARSPTLSASAACVV